MSNLEPYTGGTFPNGRRVGRSLARMSDSTTIAVSKAQSSAEIEAARVNGIASVASTAMHDVALMSQIEQSLATAVPHASGRLATIADMAAISCAEVVCRAGRRIGGC